MGSRPRELAGSNAKSTSKQIRALAISPDGQIMASGGWDSTIMLWEARTGQCVGDAHRT